MRKPMEIRTTMFGNLGVPNDVVCFFVGPIPRVHPKISSLLLLSLLGWLGPSSYSYTSCYTAVRSQGLLNLYTF